LLRKIIAFTFIIIIKKSIMNQQFLTLAITRLLDYKKLADDTFKKLDDAAFNFSPNEESNSIAVIIQHVSGNMISRWTNFLTTDGEKEWRKRDEEFEPATLSKIELIQLWENGWQCCITALQALSATDMLKTITIRQQPLLVFDAINRQLAHYPYHIGQIVYIAKMLLNQQWQTLSIARNKK
jgi:Protein of unknown function (DUF1572)